METKMIRTKKGTVVSDKMDKTIAVVVTTYKTHPKYKKRYQVTKKFYAHDEKESFSIGDVVTIKETRPLSKLKCWVVLYPTDVK